MFVVAIGDEARLPAHLLVRDLRHAGLMTLVDYDVRPPRAQMKRADRTGARHVVIVGGDELARGEVSIKDMITGKQTSIARGELFGRLREALPACAPPAKNQDNVGERQS